MRRGKLIRNKLFHPQAIVNDWQHRNKVKQLQSRRYLSFCCYRLFYMKNEQFAFLLRTETTQSQHGIHFFASASADFSRRISFGRCLSSDQKDNSVWCMDTYLSRMHWGKLIPVWFFARSCANHIFIIHIFMWLHILRDACNRSVFFAAPFNINLGWHHRALWQRARNSIFHALSWLWLTAWNKKNDGENQSQRPHSSMKSGKITFLCVSGLDSHAEWDINERKK